MVSTDTAPASWQPSHPDVFRSDVALAVTLTSDVHETPLELLAFDTMTGMAVDWLFPAVSTAVATMVWLPSATVVVFHAIPYGADVSSEPSCTPSTKNRTAATPTLSL